MKRLLFVFLLISSFTYSQNSFPTSGNVGIGTTTPADQLEVVSGYRKVGLNYAIPGVSAGGVVALSRSDDGAKIMLMGGAASPVDDGVIFTSGGSSELRLVSAGGSSSGFGFYTNVSAASAFGSTRPTPVFKVDGSGNLGLGTTTPGQKIDIRSGMVHVVNYSLGTYSHISRYQDPGNDSYFYHLISPNFHILGSSKNGTGLQRKLGFALGGADTESDIKMTIDVNGNVGIGNTAPDAKLTVSGQVHATEVKVTLNAPGPDYVFDKEYLLRSLPEVATFIEENKHLPEVPSAMEMEKGGINLSEMNMLLLKKVEELTLYVIQLKKDLDSVKAEKNKN